MIKAIVSDFSRVLLFPKDRTYQGTLNGLHKELAQKPGYNALDHFDLNIDLLDYYQSLKNKVKLYIFTSDIIQDAPEFQQYLQPVFTKIYSASKLNIDKKDISAYKKITAELELSTQEILYIDDNRKNIEAAETAGLKTLLYQNNEDLFTKIGKLNFV